MLQKGVPSTFANLKHLYGDEFKRSTLPAIVEAYIADDVKSATNGDAKAAGDTSKGDSAAYYFLAQHYNYYLSRDLARATENIDKAIELEPESVDFYMTKARIWKHYGNTKKASETMAKARELDDRDRHINTKAAKYQLRNDENAVALETLGKFTRAETGPLVDLHDMQCMWFLYEDGASYVRQKNYGLALKRFTSVHSVFDTWQEDQFDFHNFVLRKGQMRAYVDMMRWEDRLRDHPFYSRAALSAVKVYIKLHDEPLGNGSNGDANGDADANAQKKAAKKARKEAQKAELEAAAKKAEPNKAVKDEDGQPKKVDDDPNGDKLAATADPLADAMKFLTPLLQFSPDSIDAQLAGFEVFIRRGMSHSRTTTDLQLTRSTDKYLLALKCLNASSALDAAHPTVHEQTVRLKRAIDSAASSLDAKTAEVIKSEFSLIPESTSLAQFNADFLARHKESAAHVLSASRVQSLLTPTDKKAVSSILELPSTTLEQAIEGLSLADEKDGYRSVAASKWPNATAFQTAN